jgi:tripartite-type tricarboxylate transporter receptor subunit TctC
MAEAGVPSYEVYEWNAIFAPAGTPAPVIARLAEAIEKTMQAPDIRERVAALGGEIAGFGPKDADTFVREQTELWAKVIRLADINPD